MSFFSQVEFVFALVRRMRCFAQNAFPFEQRKPGDMTASFVNHGAIDEAMFNAANIEHISVFAKIEPYLSELREMTKLPQLMGSLEKLVKRMSEAEEKLRFIRERSKAAAEDRANAAGAANRA